MLLIRGRGRGAWSRMLPRLNFFYVAGAIFLWASGRDLFPRRSSLRYLLINSLPAVALLTVLWARGA